MPNRTPFTPEQRDILSRMGRECRHLSDQAIANRFFAETGRRTTITAASRARHGWFDGPSPHRMLDESQRRALEAIVVENLHEANWSEMAEVFRDVAGRSITAGNVAKFARSIGIAENRAATKGNRRPPRIAVERGAAAAHDEKLANAPYRPGYFAKSYRGPDGGDGVRVYRASGPAKEVGGVQ